MIVHGDSHSVSIEGGAVVSEIMFRDNEVWGAHGEESSILSILESYAEQHGLGEEWVEASRVRAMDSQSESLEEPEDL